MRNGMITKKLIVKNSHGIHARVALKVAQTCQNNSSEVTVCNGCNKANGCSLLELLMLGVEQGSEIEIIARGGEEEKSIKELSYIFDGGSGI